MEPTVPGGTHLIDVQCLTRIYPISFISLQTKDLKFLSGCSSLSYWDN